MDSFSDAIEYNLGGLTNGVEIGLTGGWRDVLQDSFH